MLKIFETEKIKALDQYTMDSEPIAPIDFVERAATAFVSEYSRHYSKQSRAVVFAGQGNNGADALAVARLLSDEGFRVEAYLINPSHRLSPETEENRQRLLAVPDALLTEVTGEDDFEPPELTGQDVVIDGLFGSGLNRSLEEGHAALVDYINQSGATVVAIDIPSGIFGEDNGDGERSAVIRADRTFTFEFPKLAFFLPENAAFVGKWTVVSIGIHPEIIEQTDTCYHMVTDADISGWIMHRNRFAHKGDFGHALLVAGSRGRMGAAVLAAKACLRSGAGLLTVHLPSRGETVLQTAIPEAMLSLDEAKDFVSKLPDMERYNAIAAGPGLGLHAASVSLMEELLKAAEVPLVLDADALNILAQHREWLPLLPPNTLLTPHPKEFDRLFGHCASGYERLQKAMEEAETYGICILLKGACSVVCTPAGKVYINTTGNPGMATAGSGDVLTGILLGLLAQGYDPEKAAVTGAWLHGLAGDLAVADASEESLIAGDIVRKLGKAFRLQKEDALCF